MDPRRRRHDDTAEELLRPQLEEDPGDEDDDQEEVSAPSEEEERLQEKALKTRTILVSESITDELARKVFMQLLVLEAESPEKPITVLINSPGGEADSGFGIHDMLRFVAPPVRTIVSGLCASAAVMVFLAGEPKQRFSLPHSRFMMHQPSSQTFGQASDLKIASTEIVRLRSRYNQVVADAIGKDLAQVSKDVDRDFWLSAQDAHEYGLVDRVIVRRSDIS
ncbi:MAG: ATP-dependent Clp protease proteolytic subunit [Candidatus Eisenbacteria sp.]|nr:ATP-dependent Clp protease proteolytic subunit [Candidatus Eisenbacteria bacterium]